MGSPRRRLNLRHLSLCVLPLCAPLAILLAAAPPAAAGGYQVTNLVSNTPGVAAATDPNLINPWGISASPTGPFWVSNNGTNTSTLYNTAGAPLSLVVSTPTANSTLGPTGQVFNGSTDFGGKNFLFASEDGTLSGWKGGADGTKAVVVASGAAHNADYTGIAIANHELFAANVAGGGLDVFNSTFGAVATITDSNANGSSPFNVQNLGGTLYVTYFGKGGDFLDSVDPNTFAFTRLATGGALHGAWGLAQAPANFGAFGGDLLVGNFFNGAINAYDKAGAFQGAMTDTNGNAIVIPGLWGLTAGNGGAGGAASSVYFAAGGPTETSGLFGRLDAPAPPVPEASTTTGLALLLALGLGGLAVTARRKKAAKNTAE